MTDLLGRFGMTNINLMGKLMTIMINLIMTNDFILLVLNVGNGGCWDDCENSYGLMDHGFFYHSPIPYVFVARVSYFMSS